MDSSTFTLIAVSFFSLSIILVAVLFTEFAFAFVFAPPGSSPTDREKFNLSRQRCKASHQWCKTSQRYIPLDKEENQDDS